MVSGKEQVPDDENMEATATQDVLPGDASVDLRGRLVNMATTGGWKASFFIFATEVTERFAFYSILANLVIYLVTELHQPIPKSVNIVTNWIGTSFVLCLLGGFIADSYCGRYYTLIVFSSAYLLGMIVITLSATIQPLKSPACNYQTINCQQASEKELSFFLGGLYVISLGTGGIKACVSTFGADQFDEADEKERKDKHSFFNWFFLAINMGALLAITVSVYIQDRIGWGWGYGIATVSVVISLGLLLHGTQFYRHKVPCGSPFTRFAKVITNAVRNWKLNPPSTVEELYETKGYKVSTIPGVRKLKHTNYFRFLDKAAAYTASEISLQGRQNSWRRCTVTEVEELKLFLRIIPIVATTMFVWTGYAQISTLFVQQGTSLNRHMGPHFQIPPASLPIFTTLNSIIVIPLYDKLLVPVIRRYTRHERGLTPLRRIGIGVFTYIISMIVAALVERKRLTAIKLNNLTHSKAPIPMTIFWLAPQYFLVGTAEVFVYVGQLEFFYDEISDGMRTLSTSLFLAEVGLGSWISTFLITIVRRVTGKDDGWITDNLNGSRLDKLYWLIAILSTVNFLLYLLCANSYTYKTLVEEAQTCCDTENVLDGNHSAAMTENDLDGKESELNSYDLPPPLYHTYPNV